ncbi:MAG: Gfo/Idh/MocA family oxidoreductase [Clostridia bacterium]|nr:Gfo/Idh/MocA family oxidoreductase [Clostridia bacterium]MBQ9798299.1 Gfo/Idh/MocA family oxidoreductase [Clostridia bacterium]
MKLIRFGIVGCGIVSQAHAASILALDGLELAGCYDHSAERSAEFAAQYGTKAYPSYSAMVADETIDAVCICTPSGLHADQAVQALREGKHVFLEKPMALNAHDAARVCRAAETSHHLITVVSQNRFRADVLRLRELIQNGSFGRLVLCDLYMKFWRDPSYYANSTWRGTYAMDGGGALMNQGIHGVDLMRFLVGDAKLLRGRAKTIVHDIEVEDTAVAMLEFDCGALGVIEASTATAPGFSRRIEIQGERGYAILTDVTLEKLCIDGKMLVDLSVEADAGTASDPTQLKNEGHLLQLRNFAAAIRGKEELLSTPRDGYEAVRLIEEIYQSSKL